MTTAAVHQPQYLPYLGFFHKIARADVFVVLDDVQFHRRGLQHRNRIKTSQGWQWLTVPVGGASHEVIRDVRLSPEAWQQRHRRALTLNYARAPYFEEYGPGILDLLERPWDRLVDLDMALLEWAMGALGISTPIVDASSLGAMGQRSELLVSLCRAVGATGYLSGPGGVRYMDLDVFEAGGIEVHWQDFTHPIYEQLFPRVGFIRDLSIVDALFCCGAGAADFVGSDHAVR